MGMCLCGCEEKCKRKYVKGHFWRGKFGSERHCFGIKRLEWSERMKELHAQGRYKNAYWGSDARGIFDTTGISAWNKGLTKETDGRIDKQSKKMKGRKHSKEQIEKAAKKLKNLWKNSHSPYVDVTLPALLKSRTKIGKPNHQEKKLLAILQLDSREKWHYTGDGRLVIAKKNPDFWNGRKAIIELFGDYWHKGDDPTDKIHFYKEHGYNCLVVWEHELEDAIALQKKIADFVKGS